MVLILISLPLIYSRKTLGRSLTANINVAGVSSKSDTLTQESVNQEYTLNWMKSLTPYVALQSGLRYYRFGTNQNLGPNSWRSEFQPSGEIRWKHPNFNMGVGAQRRDSHSNDQTTDLVNELYFFNARTSSLNFPFFNLRYQQDKIYNRFHRQDRDTRGRILTLGSGYDRRSSGFRYGFTFRQTDDRVTKHEQRDYLHSLRLYHTATFGHEALRVNAVYNVSYRSLTDIAQSTLPIYRTVPAAVGLYNIDATPDLGGLDTNQTLIDSNLVAPAQPLIDIGNNSVNRNLGLDFGQVREVGALYIYTDRPSGNNVTWKVFLSDDNVSWNAAANSTSSYRTGFSRYEVFFDPTETRYLKAVNSGINDRDTVYITEIEGLLDISRETRIGRDQTAHQLDLGNSIRLSKKLTANLDGSWRRRSGISVGSEKDESFYTAGMQYRMSKVLTHAARYQIGLSERGASALNVSKTLSLTHASTYKPLATLEFSVSLLSRHSYIGPMKFQELNNVLLRGRGELLPQLRVGQEVGLGKNNLYQSNLNFQTLTYKLNCDGDITSSLNASVGYFYQRTEDQRTNLVRVKNQYIVNGAYRLTSNISLRGSADLIEDENRRFLAHEYAFSWTASHKLTLGAGAHFSEFESESSTARYNATAEYSLTQRSVVTFSYSSNDVIIGEGLQNKTFYLGMRTGF